VKTQFNLQHTQRDQSRDWEFKGSSTNFGNYRYFIRDIDYFENKVIVRNTRTLSVSLSYNM